MYALISSFFFVCAIASPFPKHEAKPLYWLLAGDSTTAPDGGWGDAFLSTTVASDSSGHNYGHSGATTASFRASGNWTSVTRDINTYKSDYQVFVTIQFGHNDQKNTSGVSLSQYKENLLNFVKETTTAGGHPILVTPLTRRNFQSDGKVAENLATQRNITIEVATYSKTKYIDLNKASETYVNAIGKDAASKYNLAAGDWTHLNEWGGVVFARIVSDLLVEKYPVEFEAHTKANDTLSDIIKAGEPA
ncbi:carbohydrate esterase family 12 protein [Periconia macrospinosa]|uniref:Carbohydrate esterase family 12 protein n=1 Tax=Periconia macrospinosa TaxID=97972 RepID=A0A2V1DHV0_9PLEO|nr:carbohydrate esterase family 12 protein [Periconia macrospinosa]